MTWTPKHLKALRRHVGMTQAELAEYLGYGNGGQVRVSDMERGEMGISGPVGRLLDLLAERHNFAVQQKS